MSNCPFPYSFSGSYSKNIFFFRTNLYAPAEGVETRERKKVVSSFLWPFFYDANKIYSGKKCTRIALPIELYDESGSKSENENLLSGRFFFVCLACRLLIIKMVLIHCRNVTLSSFSFFFIPLLYCLLLRILSRMTAATCFPFSFSAFVSRYQIIIVFSLYIWCTRRKSLLSEC